MVAATPAAGGYRRPTRAEWSLAALNEMSLEVLRGQRASETLSMTVQSARQVFDADSAGVVTAAGDTGPKTAVVSNADRAHSVTSVPDRALVERHLAVTAPMVSGRYSFGQLVITRASVPFTTEDVEAVEGFASAAARILAAGQERAQAESRMRDVAAQLQTALDTRIIIEQAKGIIAAVRNIDVEEAFDRLRKHSRSHNANIHDTAAAVVRRRLLP